MLTHIYYHVACMGHWREIVAEQLRLLEGCEHKVRIGFTGDQHEAGFIFHTATCRKLDFEIMFTGSGNHNYEFPTLERLKMACDAGECDRVIYFHTKGASSTGDWRRLMWRWFMNAYILRWREAALEALADYDWVAPTIYQGNLKDWPTHSCGNFWAANASFIRSLPTLNQICSTFRAFCEERDAPSWVESRHAAEMWLGFANPPAKYTHLHHDNACNISDFGFWCSRPDLQQFSTTHGS